MLPCGLNRLNPNNWVIVTAHARLSVPKKNLEKEGEYLMNRPATENQEIRLVNEEERTIRKFHSYLVNRYRSIPELLSIEDDYLEALKLSLKYRLRRYYCTCARYLKDRINLNNIFDFVDIALEFPVICYENDLGKAIVGNLSEEIGNKMIRESNLEQMKMYLSLLKLTEMYTIDRYAFGWLRENPERAGHWKDLLDRISFSQTMLGEIEVSVVPAIRRILNDTVDFKNIFEKIATKMKFDQLNLYCYSRNYFVLYSVQDYSCMEQKLTYKIDKAHNIKKVFRFKCSHSVIAERQKHPYPQGVTLVYYADATINVFTEFNLRGGRYLFDVDGNTVVLVEEQDVETTLAIKTFDLSSGHGFRAHSFKNQFFPNKVLVSRRFFYLLKFNEKFHSYDSHSYEAISRVMYRGHSWLDSFPMMMFIKRKDNGVREYATVYDDRLAVIQYNPCTNTSVGVWLDNFPNGWLHFVFKLPCQKINSVLPSHHSAHASPHVRSDRMEFYPFLNFLCNDGSCIYFVDLKNDHIYVHDLKPPITEDYFGYTLYYEPKILRFFNL